MEQQREYLMQKLKSFYLNKSKKSIGNLPEMMKQFLFVHNLYKSDKPTEKREFLEAEVKSAGVRITFEDGTMISPGKLWKRIVDNEYTMVNKSFKRKKLKLDVKEEEKHI